MNRPFSLTMCVTSDDNPAFFEEALESVASQTLLPAETVVLADGPVTDAHKAAVEKYREPLNIKFYALEKRSGHGVARREAVSHCAHDIVAVFDADDISVPDRFEKELFFMAKNGLDVVGSDIAEFRGSRDNVVSVRKVCETDAKIKEDLKKRSPMNQMTVVFRKEAYEKAGGYLDLFCEEDYYLWARMAKSGAVFGNIQENLVYVRTDMGTFRRRGGKRYYESEKTMQKYLLENGLITKSRYNKNVAKRFIVQRLMPAPLRRAAFGLFARRRVKDGR